MELAYPKPDYRAAKKRRKAQAKNLDKETQVSGETNWCAVGHWAEQTTSHHIVGRRVKEKRHDQDNLVRLCYRCHNLIHSLSRDRFADKILEMYRIDLRDDPLWNTILNPTLL